MLLRRIRDGEHMSSSLCLGDAAPTDLPLISVSLPTAFPWEKVGSADCIGSTETTKRAQGGLREPRVVGQPHLII